MNKPLTIRQLRLMHEISQVKMAEMLGVHVNTYVKWEKEPQDIPVNKAILMCQIFDTNFESVIFLP